MMPLAPSVVLVLACLQGLACSDQGAGGTSEGEAGSTSETSASTASTTAPETGESGSATEPGTSEAETSAETTSEGPGFVPQEPDVGPGCAFYSQCDDFAQDCPEGEKCGPIYVELCGSAITACTPITGAKGPGQACTVSEAGDDCGADSYCYPAALGFFDEPSVCVPFCVGTVDDNSCGPGTTCAFDRAHYWGPIGCLPVCDPLGPEACAEFEACTLGSFEQDDFACMAAPAKVAPGVACVSSQMCADGLCVDGVTVEGCPDDRCCASLCDELAPDCPVGASCVHVDVLDPESTVGVCQVD